jgi:predicted nucleotidyltransferase
MHEEAFVDGEIASRLQIVTKAIIQNVRNVRSIFLTGGFGKGEGSVEVKQERETRFFRDFDIAVIVDSAPQRDSLKKLYDQIYRSLGLPNPENSLFRFSSFVVDIRFLKNHDLIYPDIWFYDLKVASKLLWGEDIRGSIRTDKMSIPLSSGLRVLFEKVCGLLGNFSYGNLKPDCVQEEEEESLIFECYKTFIEICTALCIISRNYDSKYVYRAKNLQNIYRTEFPDLAQVLPDLPETVTKCTDFKLRPDFDRIHEDPVKLWFDARDTLETILCWYLEKYSGLSSTDWDSSQDQIRAISKSYYKPFLNSLIRKRLRSSNEIILDVSSLLFQALVNIEYSYVVTRHFSKAYIHPLRDPSIAPSLKFFLAGAMILFSLNKDGTIEKRLLEKAISQLRCCIPIKVSTLDGVGWDITRKHFLKAYGLYRGYHFVK